MFSSMTSYPVGFCSVDFRVFPDLLSFFLKKKPQKTPDGRGTDFHTVSWKILLYRDMKSIIDYIVWSSYFN